MHIPESEREGCYKAYAVCLLSSTTPQCACKMLLMLRRGICTIEHSWVAKLHITYSSLNHIHTCYYIFGPKEAGCYRTGGCIKTVTIEVQFHCSTCVFRTAVLNRFHLNTLLKFIQLPTPHHTDVILTLIAVHLINIM